MEHFAEAATKNTRQETNDTVSYMSPNDYPCIDISSWMIHEENGTSLLSEDTFHARQQVVQQVLEQALDAGSFFIVGHGVPTHLLQQLETEGLEFFRQTKRYKSKYTGFGQKTGYGGIIYGERNHKKRNTVVTTERDTEQSNTTDSSSTETPTTATTPQQPSTNNESHYYNMPREVFHQVSPRNGPLSAAGMNKKAPDSFQAAIDTCLDRYLSRMNIALHEIFAAALELAHCGTCMELPTDYFTTGEQVNGHNKTQKRPGAVWRAAYFHQKLAKEGGGGTNHSRRRRRHQKKPLHTSDGLDCAPVSAPSSLTISYGTVVDEVRNGQWVRVPIPQDNQQTGDDMRLHVSIGQLMHLFSNGLFQESIRRAAKDMTSNTNPERFGWSYMAVTSGAPGLKSYSPLCCARAVQAAYMTTCGHQHGTCDCVRYFSETNPRRYFVSAVKNYS